MTEDKGKKNTSLSEILYLVLTDVVGSCEIDNKNKGDQITWRKDSFQKQLEHLLSKKNSCALKSMGDALFVIYTATGNEKDVCKEVIDCVWKAFSSTKAKGGPKIRCVIHKIINHSRGKKIAAHLETITTKGDKEDLITTLKKDIFGSQVNAATRIISLVHASTILVSQDVVLSIDDNANENALVGKDIIFEYKEQKFKLHSPVPVLYMKGVLDCKKEDDTPYIIWELDLENSEKSPKFAVEFKEKQTFRLINLELISSIDSDKKRSEVVSECLKKLSIKNPKFKLRFYVDCIWEIQDYYSLADICFIRKKREIYSTDYIRSLKNLLPKAQEGENNILKIKGQSGKLIISASANSLMNISYKFGDTDTSSFFIPLLTFNSFPDYRHEIKSRELLKYSKNKRKSGLIKSIEPQSIDIFKNIRFNSHFVNKYLKKDVLTTNFQGFRSSSILFFFQVYLECLSDTATLNALFNGVEDIDENLKVAFYGLTPGLLDGFVFYNCKEISVEQGIKIILDRLVSISSQNNFYHKIYPTTIFSLKNVETYDPLKKNIGYINSVYKNSKNER